MKKVCIHEKCFNEQVLCSIIFTLVGLIALIGLVILYKSTLTGGATYQQYAQRPVLYLPFDITCEQVQCLEEPAFVLEKDELTGNTICGCYEGTSFQVDNRKKY